LDHSQSLRPLKCGDIKKDIESFVDGLPTKKWILTILEVLKKDTVSTRIKVVLLYRAQPGRPQA